MKHKCATTDCDNHATPSSEWCLNCRASLYRWLRMSSAQRASSMERANLRYNRVHGFPTRRLR